jgi:hypothetical protein
VFVDSRRPRINQLAYLEIKGIALTLLSGFLSVNPEWVAWWTAIKEYQYSNERMVRAEDIRGILILLAY